MRGKWLYSVFFLTGRRLYNELDKFTCGAKDAAGPVWLLRWGHSRKHAAPLLKGEVIQEMLISNLILLVLLFTELPCKVQGEL